jgi:hypothetical protein
MLGMAETAGEGDGGHLLVTPAEPKLRFLESEAEHAAHRGPARTLLEPAQEVPSAETGHLGELVHGDRFRKTIMHVLLDPGECVEGQPRFGSGRGTIVVRADPGQVGDGRQRPALDEQRGRGIGLPGVTGQIVQGLLKRAEGRPGQRVVGDVHSVAGDDLRIDEREDVVHDRVDGELTLDMCARGKVAELVRRPGDAAETYSVDLEERLVNAGGAPEDSGGRLLKPPGDVPGGAASQHLDPGVFRVRDDGVEHRSTYAPKVGDWAPAWRRTTLRRGCDSGHWLSVGCASASSSCASILLFDEFSGGDGGRRTRDRAGNPSLGALHPVRGRC